VVAVIGMTAATLGATHVLEGHDRRTVARHGTSKQAHIITAEGVRTGVRAGVQQASVSEPLPTSAPKNGDAQLVVEQHGNGGPNASSEQGSGNGPGDSGSQGTAGSVGGINQSGSQRTTVGVGGKQAGTQHQSSGNQRSVSSPPGTNNNVSQAQQASEGNQGSSSGRSGANLSPPRQGGQSGSGN
jgi:hypothetical protein